MQAKLNDGWQFPRVRCRNNHTGDHCCAGVAAPEDVQRNDAGAVIVVDYRCEFGHGWFWFAEDGEIIDANDDHLDPDRIVQDNREIAERWACRQCANDRGNPALVIWPVSTPVCPFCEQGTRYDCLDCGEQLRTDQTVYREADSFLCDSCWMEQNTVPASEVEA